MMLAEAIPAAGAGLADLAIPIGVVLGLCFLIGARAGYDYSFGALLRKAASLFTAKIPFTSIGVPGGGALATVFEKVDHIVQDSLAAGITGLETVLAKWWHAQEQLVRYTFDSLAWFAGETYNSFDSLIHGHLPTFVHSVTHPITVGLGKVGARFTALERTLEVDLTRTARALEAEIERDFGKAWRGIDHLRGSVAGSLAGVAHVLEGDIAHLRDYAHRILNRRLTRLEKLLGVGVISAIALATLTKYFPYWRCTNFRRFARGVCRSPLGSLDWIFALASFVLVALNPKEIAQIGQDVTNQLSSLWEGMSA
jgi:hypothetical protein